MVQLVFLAEELKHSVQNTRTPLLTIKFIIQDKKTV